MEFVSLFKPVTLNSDPQVSSNGEMYFNSASSVYRMRVSGSWISLINNLTFVDKVVHKVYHFGGGVDSFNYTLSTEHVNGILHFEPSGSGNITIPDNSVEPIPVGSIFKIVRASEGELDFSISGSVTLNVPSDIYLKGVWDTIDLIKTEENSWILSGEFRDLY